MLCYWKENIIVYKCFYTAKIMKILENFDTMLNNRIKRGDQSVSPFHIEFLIVKG